MDLKSNQNSFVRTDPVAINKSRLGSNSTAVPYSMQASTISSSGLHLAYSNKKSSPGKLDDVRATSWLDAMKSSSPPRMVILEDTGFETVLDEPETAYRTWVMKHPSALTSFDQILNFAKGKQIAIFLDYDGTLSPIVDNPDCAVMTSAMRAAVKNVATCFPTAIISGRSRDKVYEFVGLAELYYAGSHGMDIMGPVRESGVAGDHPDCIKSTDNQGKEVNLFQPASEFIPMVDEVFKTLIQHTNEIKGSKVENNKFCLSVHYRNVDEQSWGTIAQCVYDVLKEYPRLRLTHGRKVLEVRPVIDWNKGKAVEFLLESLGLSNCDDVLPIYVGDDRTDEDAFQVLKEGNRGYGILVSSIPKETNAFYSLRDTSEVMDFLNSLASWKKSESKGNDNSLL